jgi:hypothetical protein
MSRRSSHWSITDISGGTIPRSKLGVTSADTSTQRETISNDPQFDLPNHSIGSPSAGKVTVTVGTPRDIQFSLRLAF